MSDQSETVFCSSVNLLISNDKTRGKRSAETTGTSKKKKSADKPEVAPELVVKPRRQFVDAGGSAKFKASFDGSKATKLSWSKDGNTLVDDGTHFKMYEKDGFHFLEVSEVTMDDHGLFTVVVENSAGSDQASADLDVFEKPQLLSRESVPSWQKPLKDLKTHLEEPVLTLECVAQDLIQPSVKWFHNEKEIFSGFHMKMEHEGQRSTLSIKDVRATDIGEFRCVMTGTNGEIDTCCRLAVGPAQKVAPPVFVKELHDMTVEDGDKLELVVEVKDTDNGSSSSAGSE